MLSHLKTGKSSFSIPGVGSSATTGSKRTKSLRQSASATVATKKKSGTQTTTFGRRGTTTTSSVTTTTSTSAAASPAPSSTSAIKIPAEIRKSSRRTTVLNNQETELKLLEYETRKAMQPKREKVVAHKMTQAELLEEAKKTEELNLASLQAFKAMEMEKKRVVKKKDIAMESFVRYHSFAEWIGHGPLIQALADTGTPGGTRPPTRPGSRTGSRAGSAAPEIIPTQYGSGQSGSGGGTGVGGGGGGGGIPPQSLAQSLAQSLLQQQQIQLQQEQNASRSINAPCDSNPVSEGIKQHKVEFNGLDSGLGSKTSASPMNLDGAVSRDVTMASPGPGTASGTTDLPSGALTPAYYATMNMSAGSIARKRKRLHPTQMCGRNWITFMGYEEEDSPINEWSYAENYPERKPMCPITGLPAKYKDPRSGVPYANKEAYKVLQNVIRHGYVWSNGLNAYCHDVAQPLPKGVPAGMAEALIGGQQIGEGIVLKDGDLISAGIPRGGGGGYTYRRRQLFQQAAYQD
ncbi:hypothetical protein BG011_006669 [Mortierella polycephala]|uniref:Vps72/YL1 C-terminal domain-containing protein n=1 Tax=Mortierella polycephala TaxID=41804 RepID=A0A9P6PVF3_9FUNG|nr:hypothetical protein BG011_006669 [Mortierella polycephala]